MKKNLLLVLLLILGISFGSGLFAQVPVIIGDGTAANTETGAPAPYGTWYKAFRQQFLVHASEFNNAGGGPGNITSLSFNVTALNTITPMNNFRIRLKHTTQTALTSAFEAGDYQVVFQAASFMPVEGWNEHNFSAPFNWDGASNLLVDIVTDVVTGDYARNASVAYTTTGFNSALRFQSDSQNGDTGTTGTTAGDRSNMKFMMEQLDMQDLVAVEITGPNSPNINSTVNYTITVKSLCPAPVSNYTVKLMKAPSTEIASLPGTSINPMQELQFTMPWTPNEEGGFQLFGRVEMPGDENPNNDNTPMLDVTVIPEGLVNVTIGDGTQANTTTGPPTPYGTYWKNFRQQYLIRASEINNEGGGPGDIYGISFNVENVNNCSPMPNYRIRIKPTTQTVLSTTFEDGDYQQVFQAASFMPTTGWNFHPFSTPFVWDGASNLLIDVVCDLVGGYTQNASVFYTNLGYNSSLRFQSDSSPADQATTGTLSTNRSNMMLNMNQLDMQDMVGMSIIGSTTPSVNSVVNYTIRVKNLSPNNVTNYTVKLMEGPNTMIASTPGTAIGPMEELEFILPWTPTVVGATQLYGRVEMPGDENPANDNTPMLDVTVMEAGLLVVQVGDGTAVNTNTGSPAPYGTWYKAFREQYLFRADEIYAAGGAPGLINALAFNVQSLDECTPMTNFQISVKHTQQTALTTSFETGEYEVVFQADTFMPTTDWNLHPFTAPFFWNGADNLIVDICTDVVDGAYARNALTYYSSPGFNSSLRFQSDSASGHTATTGTASLNRSNARFFMIVEDMGSMSGTVTSAGAPVADATVWVEDTVFTTTTAADGTYNLPFVPVGANTVSATKHGYNVVSHNVNIVDGQNTVQNFAISLLPQVTVTGRIVGSDQPTVGIADATISLSGYEPYSATTNAQGQFTIPNVFASQTYQYVANAIGYQPATGQAVVGTTNLNMGDIIVNEMAFPPYGVVANENDDFTQVNVTWEAPDPSAVDITEGFEGDTFPPEDWSQIITNPNPGGLDVMATWCRFGTIALDPVVPPHSGDWQAGLWWEYGHQDEWLITPEFTCPPNTELKFWSYVFLGSTHGDHYYVKASTDGGNTWTVLWDASEQTGEWNYYATPITVPLDAVAGQQVKLAWQAIDGDGQGLWYVWFIDDISIGMPDGVLRFPMNQFTTRSASENNGGFAINSTGINRPISRAWVDNPELEMASRNVATARNDERVMNGYRVYRLLTEDQANEANWTELTPSNITPTNYTDTAWGPLPSGVYKYAVKAVYTNNVMSVPAFSNELHKGMMGVLSGTVTEFGTDLPIEGATITAGDYSGVSNAQGEYSFSVYAGTYNVTCSKVGYQASTQNGVVIVGLQTTTQNFVLTEITLPPGAVQAEEAGENVNITWMEPGTAGGEWIYYCGDKDDSIGTGGAADFDVAIRFPASALTDYAGMSLQAVKVWPAQGGTFKARVWTGGTAAAPAVQEVDQLFTPDLDTYNTVILDDPVAITGTEELWFGYNCNVTTGYPAGCDAGPADDGLGNMMYFQGEWDTLLGIAPSLDYNWNIQGYVGYGAPTDAPRITPISLRSAYPGQHNDMERALTGYQVWRLQQGQEGSENSWTSLTPNPISATAYQDTQWSTLEDGTYKWAVKAIYTGGAASPVAFSNPLPRITQIGTVAGIVRNGQNAPISGATITCGDATATTNASGAYSMQVIAGTHSVTASHPNYASVTETDVVVVTNQTTTVNFILPPSQVIFEDSFETYDNFAIQFAPWTLVDVDQSATYGITNTDWANIYQPQAFIIFVPTATIPPVANAEAHTGIKLAACFASTTTANNDWLITPQLEGVDELKFWARSFTAQYGLERFKVGVSTSGTNPTDFTIISGDGFVSAPDEWTEYTYDLSSYADDTVYIGLNCISDDAFFLMVDDFEISGATDADDHNIPAISTALNANFPNPFNPETTITYSLREASPVNIEIYNIKGQLVKTLVNDHKAAGSHTVIWNGTDNSNRSVSSGVYYYKMNAGKYSSTRKMILMK